MRTIIHLSDLHFDRVDQSLVPKLIECATQLKPDIVAVSGDFTQHARPAEFQRASDFLRKLPGHLILVPGNHDMAFLNPWRRATQRLKLYKQHITSNLQPFYCDAEIAILGLNTARVLHLRNGRIREWQVDQVEELMGLATPDAIRILVTHHPFDLPETYAAAELIGTRVIKRIVASVDVMLAGHMHISHAAPTALRYKFDNRSAIFVQAGTALSTRARGEANSFQLIRTGRNALDVEQYSACEDGFQPVKSTRFVRSSSGWAPELVHVNPAESEAAMHVLQEEQQFASRIPGTDAAPVHRR